MFAPNKPTCTTGFSLGLTAGGDATAGLSYGAGANGSVGAGVFGGSNGLDAGAFASGGAGENLGSGASIPFANLIGRFFAGLVVDGGVGGFITNASQADQLQGLSGTWTVDLDSRPITEEKFPRRLWVRRLLVVAHNAIENNWIVLLASAALLFNSVRGLMTGTGSVILFYRAVTRSKDGYLYWSTVWGSAVLGIAAVLAVIF